MKKHLFWSLIPALLFVGAGCKKKEEPTGEGKPAKVAETPQTGGEQPVPVPQPVPQPVPGTLSPQQRGEMVGFARYLPQDTEFLISVHDGSDAARRIMASKLWRTFAADAGLPGGVADEIIEEGADEIADEMAGGPAMMLGQEFTLAMGKGTSKQLQHLVKLNRRLNYFQMSGFIRAVSKALAQGEESEFFDLYIQFNEELFRNLIQDPESGVGLFEKLNMPPTYIAFKTTDERREAVDQQIASFLGMMAEAPFMKPAEAKAGNSTFKGYQMMGSKIAEMMMEDRGDMEEFMGSATADRLIKAISNQNLFLLSGIHGDYVLLFLGSSADDLVLVDDVGKGLAGGQALTFCDTYESKDLLAVFYGQEEGLKQFMDTSRGSFADVSAGLRDGLSSSDQFGDTRDLEALLRLVEDREAALQAMSTTHGGGTIVFFEEGLRLESYGGFDAGFNDWNASNKLAPLGKAEGVMLFANLTSNADYDAKLRGYIEALFETAYTGAMKAAELSIKSEEMTEFKNYVHLFDTKFRPDLLTFWEGFSNGFNGSLGQERALVVDLQGGMPAIPGLPQAFVDECKFPRAAWIAPVVDRSKLGAAWEKMNTSLTSMSATISEMVGEKIPMQKPLSSEKDGSTTWFFSLPFFNDDFVPSVTVNDKWFAASTSKLQAVDLIAKAEAGGETTQGFVMTADFKQLEVYAKHVVGLLSKNGEDFDISQGEIEMINRYIEAFADFDSMNVHVRRENGQLRSSFHFKTR